MSRGNKQISNKKTKPGQKEKKQSVENNQIVLDFSLPIVWVSGRNSDFCNFLKDDDDFFGRHKVIFDEITVKVSQCSFDTINTLGKHCHTVTGKDTLQRIKNAMIDIYKCKINCDNAIAKEYVNQIIDGQVIFQVGFTGSTRIFCIKEREHHLKVILIDYHHDIYPNVKYNAIDKKTYTWAVHDR